ncbi:cytochrome c oxidase subunit 7A2, mitochondrial-like [Musca autumnalis]|uniref:cytochrome c oxidase subunit 7A2, mitochondrial-like n=1 Tax=Musca autumnalis TaxID=221902 RepID=UPI003CE75520
MLSGILKTIIQNNLNRTILLQSQRYKSTLQPKMIRLQQKFQEKNNLPIHLKGGAKDKLLFLTTMGLTGCGLVYTLVFLAGYIIFD